MTQHSATTLLAKAALLLAPFAALSLPTAAHTVAVVAQAERSIGLRDGVFDPQLEGKLRTFLTDDVAVIVGGDSRVERQVVPAVIEARTGWRAANVATTAGDLITLANALKKHGLPRAARMLIVDASIFQVNDRAIDPPLLSTACFLNMTTRERLGIYADRLGSPWSPLDFRFVEGTPDTITGSRLQDEGFQAVDKRLSLPLPKMLLNTHPWYRSIALHGARWRIFREALGRLAAFGLPVYVFQPPVSPAWRAYTHGTFVDTAELEFGGMLRSAAEPHPNVHFLDFYSTQDPRLGNERFYDVQHTNRDGAKVFTGMLVDAIVPDVRAPHTRAAAGVHAE